MGLDEECDDGPGAGLDACSANCQSRDVPVAALGPKRVADRYLGAGRHPVAGLEDGIVQGFVATYMEVADDAPWVAVTQFDVWGRPLRQVLVSQGAAPVDDANPVAAALPDGSYALAWSDFAGDGSDLGVALRGLAGDGTLGPLRYASAGREFTQLNPDVLWTGQELVVAWEDYSDPERGPDLVYRTFDSELNPTSDDVQLAGGPAPEAAVSLARFNGGWAAAYRESTSDGRENIVVVAAGRVTRLGPVLGGPLEDRPALAALDASHLLVAFSEGTDPAATGVHNLTRLRFAVVDTSSGASAPVIQSLQPQEELLSSDSAVAQMSPSLAVGSEGPYLAWRSEARPGDASGDQLWLKRLPWVPSGASSRLDVDLPEMLLPRVCDDSARDQRAPALAKVGLPPGNALALAWSDFGKTQGAGAGQPDVVVHYAPTHLASVSGAPQVLSESWNGATGTALPARWVTDAAPPVTWTLQSGEAQFRAKSAPGTSLALVNDHTAKNVDIVTTTRLAYPTSTGVIARADANASPQTYLGAAISTTKGYVWRVYSVVNGVDTTLLSIPTPQSFWFHAIGANVDHRVRFRALTNADGSLFLGMKVWRVGTTEPVAWLMSTTLPTSHPTVQALGNAAGRFGVWASVVTSNGNTMYFDDFRATFFEGTADGDLDLVPSAYPLLLRRDVATYRKCNEDNQCTLTGGCCSGSADCQPGLSCSRYQAEGLGAGSHASVCVAEHCTDLVRSGDEVRADCGGADCQACTCSSSATLGATGFCGPGCACGRGEYPCSKKQDCLPGLVCGAETAELFGGPFQSDACVPPSCTNRVLDPGEIKPDCGGACGGGDCTNVCPQANGTFGHCRTYCNCRIAEGHCYQDDDCRSGLSCLARGARYGFSTSIFVCMPATCFNAGLDLALGESTTNCGGACGCVGCPAGCSTASATPIGATIPIPTATAYSQDFSSLGTAAAATLPDGWRVDQQASPRVVGTFAAATTTTILRSGAAFSSNATNSIYNFGSGSSAMGPGYWLDSADRAVGWLATGATVGSGGTKSGNLYAQLVAPETDDLASLTVSYNVEKYRSGTTAPGWRVQLYYSVNGSNWASASSNFTTTFANDANADGFEPAPGATASATGTISVYVPRGTPFYLAWNYTTASANSVDATSASALAIDDVTISGVVSR